MDYFLKIFNIHFFSLIFLALINIYLGWKIHSKSRGNTALMHWFVLFLFSGIIISIAQANVSISDSQLGFSFWNKINLLGYGLAPIAFAFFSIIMVGKERLLRNVYFKTLLVAPGFIMLYLNWTTDLIYVHSLAAAEPTSWGPAIRNGDFSILMFFYFLLYSATALILFYRYFRNPAVNMARRAGARLVFFGALIPMIGSPIIQGVFPEFFHIIIPFANIALIIAQSVIVSYAMLKYDVFLFDIKEVSDELLKITPVAMAVIDKFGAVRIVNDGMLLLTKKSENELIGKSLGQVLGAGKNYANFLQRKLEKAMVSGKDRVSLELDILQGKSKVACKVDALVVNDGQNGIGTVIVTMVSVEELKRKNQSLTDAVTKLDSLNKSIEEEVRKRTEELDEERAKLIASINNMPIGFAYDDFRARHLLINPLAKKIFGFQAGATFEDFSALVGGADLGSVRQAVRENKNIEIVDDVDFKGSILKFFAAPVIAEPSGDLTGVLFMIQDVTNVKIIERRKDEFLAIASHELRTPLTAIIGNTSMLEDYYVRTAPNKDAAEMVRDIRIAGSRLLSIVNDFLDASKIESKKLKIDIEAVDLPRVLDGIAKEYEALFREKGLSLEYAKPKAGFPLAAGDEQRVRQIIVNLISNSLKFTKQGEVRIEMRPDNDIIELHVIDSGVGISQDVQKGLFSKYHQPGKDYMTRDVSQSTGMGLYISRMLAEAMHGEVSLVRSEPGKGSDFCLRLPKKK